MCDLPSGVNFPEDLNNQQVDKCQPLKDSIREKITEAIQSIDNLNLEDKFEIKSLSSESNIFVHNINNIIYHLRILTLHTPSSNRKAIQDILDITKVLVEAANGVSTFYNGDPTNLQSELKSGLEIIEDEFNNLLNLVQNKELPEHKQELLDMLNDLLAAVDRIRLRNKLISAQNFEALIRKLKYEVLEAVKCILPLNVRTLDRIFRYICHPVQHMHQLVRYMHNEGLKFNGEAKMDYIKGSRHLYYILTDMHNAFERPRIISDLICVLQASADHGSTGIEDLGQFLCRSDLESHDSISEALLYLTVQTLTNVYQLIRGLQMAVSLH